MFISNLLKAEVNKTVQHATDALIAFDPETATAAQMQTIQDAISNINHRLAELQVNVEGAQKKAKAEDDEIHRTIDAATLLSNQGKDDKAATLLDHVETVLNQQLANDKQDITDIQESIKQFEGRRDELATKLSQARSQTDTARRDLDRAKIERDRANDAKAQAQKDAGLMSAVSDLDRASGAMANAAKKARIEAETSRRDAQTLGSIKTGTSSDPDIAAAMAAAAGKPTTSYKSVAERLAALKANAPA